MIDRDDDLDDPSLRAALRAVDVPEDLEAQLLAIPDAERMVTRRGFWVTAAAAVLLAAGGAIALRVSSEREKPRVVAVKFWHEQCPGCRKLDPEYTSVMERMRDEPVVFLTFDMSSERSRARSAAVAQALGLQELYEERMGMFGFVVLVDRETHALLGEITAKHDADEMVEAIDEALASSGD
jgi:thiol-disulfide isomerase/thioredoxin